MDFASSGDTAYYADLNFNMPASEVFSVLVTWATAAASTGPQTSLVVLEKYMDWSLGFGATVKDVTMALKYVDGSDLAVHFPRNLGRVVFSLSTTLSSGD